MRVTRVDITRVVQTEATEDADVVAVEEPLEIRVNDKNVSVTMRTPGDDFDLACGFLFTEGLIREAGDIESVRHWGSANVVRVSLRDGVRVDLTNLDRHFYTTSSCGVCGKASIDAVRIAAAPIAAREAIDPDVIHRLPLVLEREQQAFRATGGLHGAALFDRAGALLRVREDVGRHNAVDKVIGSLFRENADLRDTILMVSSRASFEIVQKALVARIPTVASVGAPSSLAIELAREMGMTLAGFVRDGRFNIYAPARERRRPAG